MTVYTSILQNTAIDKSDYEITPLDLRNASMAGASVSARMSLSKSSVGVFSCPLFARRTQLFCRAKARARPDTTDILFWYK